MDPDLSMTREAMHICTNAQLASIQHLLTEGHKLRIFVDFSLPEGYLYFIKSRQGNMHVDSTPLHGGIDPDGAIST